MNELVDRMTVNWVYGAPAVALLLLGLGPFVDGIALPVYLALPVYMMHQFEEHDADRFRLSINKMLGAGRRGLSPMAVFVVNVVFVWFLLLAVFHLAAGSSGWGVIAAYLLGINAVVHLAAAIRTRSGNPGLITAMSLFVPLTIWIFATEAASGVQHLVGAFLVLALHAAILVWALRKEAGA